MDPLRLSFPPLAQTSSYATDYVIHMVKKCKKLMYSAQDTKPLVERWCSHLVVRSIFIKYMRVNKY